MVGATAGLRLLPDGKADIILQEVRDWLRKHPFKVGPTGAEGVSASPGRAGPCWAAATLSAGPHGSGTGFLVLGGLLRTLRSHAGSSGTAHRYAGLCRPQFGDDDVKILSGVDEGAFAWLTLNYLLGRLGASEQDTGACTPPMSVLAFDAAQLAPPRA